MTEEEEAEEIIKRLKYPPIIKYEAGYFYCPYIPLQFLDITIQIEKDE